MMMMTNYYTVMSSKQYNMDLKLGGRWSKAYNRMLLNFGVTRMMRISWKYEVTNVEV